MIVNAWGIVLSRRDLGEADRLAVVYTETFGKLPVRFVGVNKPGRKLKALCEPFCWGEYRLYMSPRSEYAKAVGGRIIATFPEIRQDFNRTTAALGFCERLNVLTPNHAPSKAKYELLCGALEALEAGASPWLPAAFGLRLLEAAGFGLFDLASISAGDKSLWRALHATEFANLSELPWRPQSAERFCGLLDAHIEAQLGRPLKSREFSEKIGAAKTQALQGAPC